MDRHAKEKNSMDYGELWGTKQTYKHGMKTKCFTIVP